MRSRSALPTLFFALTACSGGAAATANGTGDDASDGVDVSAASDGSIGSSAPDAPDDATSGGMTDAPVTSDAALADAHRRDVGGDAPAGSTDAGSTDAALTTDAGSTDAALMTDAGSTDAGCTGTPSPLTATLSSAASPRKIPAGFLGINYVASNLPPTNEDWPTSTSNAGLAQTPIRSLRFPGGDPSERFDWRCPYYVPSATGAAACPSTPGARSANVTSVSDLWGTYLVPPLRTADAFVLFQTNVFGNSGYPYLGSPLSLPLPPGATTAASDPATAAAWVMANATAGIPSRWEIGNEPDLILSAQTPKLPFKTYTDKFNAQAAAIHAAAPTAKVYGPALSQVGLLDASYLDEFLTDVNLADLDGLSVHYYSGLCDTPDALWPKLAALPSQWAGTTFKSFAATMAKHGYTGPVAITEFSLGPQNCSLTAGHLTAPMWNPSLGSALVNAEQVVAMMSAGIAQAYLFDLHNAASTQYAFGLFYSKYEPSLPSGRTVDSPTPLFYAIAMLGALGDEVAGCALPSGTSPTTFGCWATRASSSGAYQVLLVNKSSTPQSVTLTGFGSATKATVHRLESTQCSPSYLDTDVRYNGVVNPSYAAALPAPSEEPVTGSTHLVTVAGDSLVLVELGT
jgi:hypothetical protein